MLLCKIQNELLFFSLDRVSPLNIGRVFSLSKTRRLQIHQTQEIDEICFILNVLFSEDFSYFSETWPSPCLLLSSQPTPFSLTMKSRDHNGSSTAMLINCGVLKCDIWQLVWHWLLWHCNILIKRVGHLSFFFYQHTTGKNLDPTPCRPVVF